jgi:hypothetical protein
VPSVRLRLTGVGGDAMIGKWWCWMDGDDGECGGSLTLRLMAPCRGVVLCWRCCCLGGCLLGSHHRPARQAVRLRSCAAAGRHGTEAALLKFRYLVIGANAQALPYRYRIR